MKKIILLIFSCFALYNCVGVSSTGVLGTGVSIYTDPRSLGTQIDDSIMQKSLRIKIAQVKKKYFINVSTKVIDGHIFIKGTVDTFDEKILLTKFAWKIEGARSVKNNLKVKDKFSLKNEAKDLLITSQMKIALLANKKVKSVNYQINTVNQIIYIFGIAKNSEERREVINEAKQVAEVKDIDDTIYLVSDLSQNKK